ncbi:hypothetical protein RISK_002677 [Rhodopirellula islandica]|uniref:DUF790 family protein n=1 Tax=Rhodopirellula islandica TaxID=595434 RepID=A0A0J1EIG7_RHOIS|nr:DUF790 family protein [Rhodopirellula islandica]KLU05314.1 hypothetical protein RISK_002677 [Rhodopirellula islandica]
MLRGEHSIVQLNFDNRTLKPDRLQRVRDAAYSEGIATCLQIYRAGIGEIRQDLHRGVAEVLANIPGCPPKRMAAFCKLLDDFGQYERGGPSASRLRQRVFEEAAPLHPIVTAREGIFEHDLSTARQKVCESLGMSWAEIESNMFSDVIELQRLQSFDKELTAEEVLSAYNVAQTQAALYRATSIRIDARSDFKTIARHAKLAQLMHRIERTKWTKNGTVQLGLRFELDGPGSSLRETTRYGVGFAKLLPKLLACQDWRMTARVLGPNKQAFRLSLSPQDGLRSPLPPENEFDSEFERAVDAAWNRNPPAGWRLERETELLVHGQSVFTPDFLMRHEDGRIIHLEVIGFWTPEYLQDKARRLSKWASSATDENRPTTPSVDRPHWLLMFPKQHSTGMAELADQLELPFLRFDPRQNPAEWIETALRLARPT